MSPIVKPIMRFEQNPPYCITFTTFMHFTPYPHTTILNLPILFYTPPVLLPHDALLFTLYLSRNFN